jgi:hypothetical protein
MLPQNPATNNNVFVAALNTLTSDGRRNCAQLQILKSVQILQHKTEERTKTGKQTGDSRPFTEFRNDLFCHQH